MPKQPGNQNQLLSFSAHLARRQWKISTSRVESVLRAKRSGSSGNKQCLLLDAKSWHQIRAFYWLRCLLSVLLNQWSALIWSESLSLSPRKTFGDQQYLNCLMLLQRCYRVAHTGGGSCVAPVLDSAILSSLRTLPAQQDHGAADSNQQSQDARSSQANQMRLTLPDESKKKVSVEISHPESLRQPRVLPSSNGDLIRPFESWIKAWFRWKDGAC